MQHGSLQNLIISQSRPVTDPALPEVGEPCTILMWTDRTPAEVVEVKPGKRPVVFIRLLDSRIVSGSGHDGSARYEFTSNPDMPVRRVTFKKGSRFYPCWQDEGGSAVAFGRAEEYRDPHF